MELTLSNGETDTLGTASPIAATPFASLLMKAEAEALSGSSALVPFEQQAVLNGVPYKAFRQSVSLTDRRHHGNFFSGPALARELAHRLHATLAPGARVLDPTCGMGDLLLAYAELLPIGPSLVATLELWSEQLAGIDKRADLIAMAKARLVALARTRGKFSEPLPALEPFFRQFVVDDMFRAKSQISLADGILFNPPFGVTTDHNISGWSSGNINAAALFLDAIINWRKAGAPIAAVLPEVLRCGSRYARFRSRLAEAGLSADCTSRGRFDPWTDVDVFTTLIVDTPGPLWPPLHAHDAVVGDYFTVRVGPLVPHRHTEKGQWQRFICARSVPAWSEGFTPNSSRRFIGPVFQPPFVVVRRTSSPSDGKRAVGAIILGDRPVAVENHLIVLLPKTGGKARCSELLTLLASDATSEYLNRAIRCRHLTTGSVMAIPWQQHT